MKNREEIIMKPMLKNPWEVRFYVCKVMMRVNNAFALSWNDCSTAPYTAKVQLEKLTEIIVKAEKDMKNCKALRERRCASRSTVPWAR